MGDFGSQDTRQLSQPGTTGATSGVSLVLYHRDGAAVVPLHQGKSIVVGRVAPSAVVVPDESLSRQHARFLLMDDGIMVEDLGSTNGTWVRGESVEVEVLRPGDVVVLGAVMGVIQRGGEQSALGLHGHDWFTAALEREVERATYFNRPVSLMMLRPADKRAPLHSWLSGVAGALRPVDRMAVYGGGTVEILLPELDTGDAVARAREVMAEAERQSMLVCGLSSFPEAATTAEMLIESCIEALREATVERPRRAARSRMVEDHSGAHGVPEGMVAESAAMRELLDMARRVARGNIPVFLHGETGTGKEVLARFLHDIGPRPEGPLVAVNCAAIPAQLVESTLFGHVRGAFTGADQARGGVFEAANNGTVLLDEIGELPAPAQAALLRVLETRIVTRIGSTVETPVDVRIITSSHRDLNQMVDKGSFRQDLLYRLNAVTLEIPPLRERRDDVLALAEHFLSEASRHNERPMQPLGTDVRAALRRFDWPGNIRQLRNVIHRAVVIADHDTIRLRDLPADVRGDDASAEEAAADPAKVPGASGRRQGESFRACIERVEMEMLVEALEQSGGNQSEAARALDMPRRTLVHKLRALGIKKASD